MRGVPLNPIASDTFFIVLYHTSQTLGALILQTKTLRDYSSKVKSQKLPELPELPELRPLTESTMRGFVFFLHPTRRPSLLTPNRVMNQPSMDNSEAWNMYVLLRNRTDLPIDFSLGPSLLPKTATACSSFPPGRLLNVTTLWGGDDFARVGSRHYRAHKVVGDNNFRKKWMYAWVTWPQDTRKSAL